MAEKKLDSQGVDNAEGKLKENLANEPQIDAIPQTYGDALNGDVIAFNGSITFRLADRWSQQISTEHINGHQTVNVLFCTCGGDPDEAFRMMRFLQDTYETINVFIFGECYSAGTLFSLGASKIYMALGAQMGPLDIQIRRDDENARISGECYREALKNLSIVGTVVFEQQFTRLKNGLNFPISTATASRIASDITVGLLAPITSQIEPSKLGETLRSQNIGVSYGMRLMRQKYSETDAAQITMRLATGYYSHSTVIDFREAQRMGLDVERFSSFHQQVFSEIAKEFVTQKTSCDFSIITNRPLKK